MTRRLSFALLLAGALLMPSRAAADPGFTTDFPLIFGFPPTGWPWTGPNVTYLSFLVESEGDFNFTTPVSGLFNGFHGAYYWLFTQLPGNLGQALGRACFAESQLQPQCFPSGTTVPEIGGPISIFLNTGFYTIAGSSLIDPFDWSEASARAGHGEIDCYNRNFALQNHQECGFTVHVTSTTGRAVTVPEPGPLLLVASGLLGIVGVGWRRRRPA